MIINDQQIIYTNKARCRDCFRCLRYCTVNAIKMKDGQAFVDIERCILCGTCIKECPQNAKQFRRDLEKVKELIKENMSIAVSIAPSFAALFTDWQTDRIPSLLRKLGFTYISETAESAYYTAIETEKYFSSKSNGICLTTACPSFVDYVEKYLPDKVNNLTPIVSPMIAHGRRIKEKLGNQTKVVFIGPCLAKKREAERQEFNGIIDAVLTFTEVLEWIEEEKIDLKMLETSEFDEKVFGEARLYPLTGGMSKTASLATDNLNTSVYSISGLERIKDAISSFSTKDYPILIEPLICAFGCVNGPAQPKAENIFARRESVINYSKQKYCISLDIPECTINLSTSFKRNAAVKETEFSDEEIRQILDQTGKLQESDRLNCGACGYLSCMENARAILMGMVEIDSCIPYTRRLAEQRTDKIIETSPNGIVILDKDLQILHMNPAFKKFFMCTNSIIGKPISYLMDPELFIKLKENGSEKIEITIRHENYGLTSHQILYKLQDEEQYIGIFVDITKNIADVEKLDTFREKTIRQAQELLDHQIEMAQQLAKLLGENTAKGEELVDNLLKLTQDERIKNNVRKKNWLWDTYTSK